MSASDERVEDHGAARYCDISLNTLSGPLPETDLGITYTCIRQSNKYAVLV